jgi:hypothetical protein
MISGPMPSPRATVMGVFSAMMPLDAFRLSGELKRDRHRASFAGREQQKYSDQFEVEI